MTTRITAAKETRRSPTGVKLRVATADLCLVCLLCFHSTCNGIERSSPSHHTINLVYIYICIIDTILSTNLPWPDSCLHGHTAVGSQVFMLLLCELNCLVFSRSLEPTTNHPQEDRKWIHSPS